MRDNQGLSEIIVSNCVSPFFFFFFPLSPQSICALIHGQTTIHQKAPLLFNIHACILMGYFNNNTRDNNVLLCHIPVRRRKKKKNWWYSRFHVRHTCDAQKSRRTNKHNQRTLCELHWSHSLCYVARKWFKTRFHACFHTNSLTGIFSFWQKKKKKKKTQRTIQNYPRSPIKPLNRTKRGGIYSFSFD